MAAGRQTNVPSPTESRCRSRSGPTHTLLRTSPRRPSRDAASETTTSSGPSAWQRPRAPPHLLAKGELARAVDPPHGLVCPRGLDCKPSGAPEGQRRLKSHAQRFHIANLILILLSLRVIFYIKRAALADGPKLVVSSRPYAMSSLTVSLAAASWSSLGIQLTASVFTGIWNPAASSSFATLLGPAGAQP